MAGGEGSLLSEPAPSPSSDARGRWDRVATAARPAVQAPGGRRAESQEPKSLTSLSRVVLRVWAGRDWQGGLVLLGGWGDMWERGHSE